jgi:hypothetical protein
MTLVEPGVQKWPAFISSTFHTNQMLNKNEDAIIHEAPDGTDRILA